MKNELLHVFRNTPFGRETLMQSVYFCRKLKIHLRVYIPKYDQFLMYFPNEIVTIYLDKSFLKFPETARSHAEEIIRSGGLPPSFFVPKRFTTAQLPDIPVDFSFMACPRSISDLTAKIGLGYIGPKVRSIIKNSTFPVLIPTQVYKEWKSVTAFFGGSANALNVMRLSLRVCEESGFPLRLFTYDEKRPRSYYEEVLEEHRMLDRIREKEVEWLFFDRGGLEENLYQVPHDALVVIGAYGHGLIRELLFGSTMEIVQNTLPNNLLIVGPGYDES